MNETVIKVENLYKEYKLGVISHGTLYRDLQSWWAKIRGKEDPNSLLSSHHVQNTEKDSFLALNNISLEIKAGDCVGIIGKNGAGKSTLLKILSRITTPTKGIVKIKGRVGSLLEVGTGFHPELTGRENIYLNGAILGMNRHEVSRKLDEIVSFAGIEKHIDTPVKRYSSGMNVRLGFAVAAHLETDILIADEVLAVGDAEFQKKAIGKMHDVSREERRTVLFVSHNMQSVSTLTEKAVLMVDGCITMYDNTTSVIQKYLSLNASENIYENKKISSKHPTITKAYCVTSHKGNVQQHGRKIEFVIEIDNPFPIESAAVSYQIINSYNIPVVQVLILNEEINFCNEKGKYILKSTLPSLRLVPDMYKIIIHFANKINKQHYETISNVVPFEVKVFGELRDYYWQPRAAIYVEDNHWQIEKIN